MAAVPFICDPTMRCGAVHNSFVHVFVRCSAERCGVERVQVLCLFSYSAVRLKAAQTAPHRTRAGTNYLLDICSRSDFSRIFFVDSRTVRLEGVMFRFLIVRYGGVRVDSVQGPHGAMWRGFERRQTRAVLCGAVR